MVKDYMVTMPRNGYKEINILMNYIHTNDVHKWIVGAEVGAGGYKHWQCRLRARDDFFKFEQVDVPEWNGQRIVTVKKKVGVGWANINMPWAHVEECSDKYEYEAKGGVYWASWDTKKVRASRFGKPDWSQEALLRALQDQNDRQVMVWYDPDGNHGKTWLVRHLYETGRAYYVLPTFTTTKEMIQAVASMAIEDRKQGYPPREIVVIDIPRSWKWSEQLYTAIETIKDGLVMDGRYSASPIDIWGIKVLVTTNAEPDRKKLSMDRWQIWNTPMF